MHKTFALTVCAVAFALVGCGKKSGDDGAGSAAGSASATSAASGAAASTRPATAATGSGLAAASGPPCASSTAYRSPAGGFCVEAPGFTAKEDVKPYDVLVSFQKGSSSFTVSVSLQDASHSTYNAMAQGMDGRSKDPAKVISKGELTGAKGKFLVENVGKHVAESLQVIVQGKTHSYACGGENFMPTVDPAILAACKSLRPAE